jgi:hypothetical protein
VVVHVCLDKNIILTPDILYGLDQYVLRGLCY